MMSVVTIGQNLLPPIVDGQVAKDAYDCVRTDDFEIDVLNGLLVAVVTYMDEHGVDFDDSCLPWAEEIESDG